MACRASFRMNLRRHRLGVPLSIRYSRPFLPKGGCRHCTRGGNELTGLSVRSTSAGAMELADRLIGQFGHDRAPFAFDAGLVVMLPIIFSVVHRFGGSVLLYALPSAGAFAVMHAFLPPHLLGADIGLLVLVASPSPCRPGIWAATSSVCGPASASNCQSRNFSDRSARRRMTAASRRPSAR